jgi:hypothetical protein
MSLQEIKKQIAEINKQLTVNGFNGDLYGKKLILIDKRMKLTGEKRPKDFCGVMFEVSQGTYGEEAKDYFARDVRICKSANPSLFDLERRDDDTTRVKRGLYDYGDGEQPVPEGNINDYFRDPKILAGLGIFVLILIVTK